MISDAGSRRGRTRLHYGLIAAFALAFGFGIDVSHQPVLADKVVIKHKGNNNGNKGNNNENKGNNNGNNGNNNGNKNWSKNNNNWNKNKNWNNNNKNWSKNTNNNNWNKNWNKNWSHYNNNWNKNWNNRAYVRNWNHRPYYGQFIGGVVLGSILAANGVGIVPYAPEPNVCWYWADPYMVRGYWDYCYDY